MTRAGKHSFKHRAWAKKMRANGSPCHYCRTWVQGETLTFDHIVPRSLGGRGSGNIVAACESCNRGKGSHILTNHMRKCTVCRAAYLSFQGGAA